MLQLIRDAMGNVKMRETFECVVEIDETYIRGKPRKANGAPVEKSKRGRGMNQFYAKVMLPDAEGKRLSGKQLYAILDWVCKEETTVATDDFRSYGILDRKEEEKFVHVTINHSLRQFSAQNGIHPNHSENFLNLVKQ
jgi:hypothetical protein